jgi:hypothetical protein
MAFVHGNGFIFLAMICRISEVMNLLSDVVFCQHYRIMMDITKAAEMSDTKGKKKDFPTMYLSEISVGSVWIFISQKIIIISGSLLSLNHEGSR